MIGPQDEQPKQGPGDFEDVVTVELCDLDRQVGALLCVTRTGEDSRESVLALASLAGEPVASRDGGLTLETLEPLERWRCRFEHGEIVLDAELEAVSQPIDFAGINHGLSRGLSHYEQLCRVRGELRMNGHAGEIGGVGRRTHHWGEPSGARFRSLYAVAGDKAITVTAVRPLGADEHGSELVTAHLLSPEAPPQLFEDARLSTIYDARGRPRTAGAELMLSGEEYPRRVSGDAVRAAGDPAAVQAAWFRWSLEGEPAQGGYRLAAPR
jgi:hypothetical protein